MSRPAFVYRAFDKAGRLLYVGCTVDLTLRLGQHAASSPWWLYADRVEQEEFPCRRDAALAEAEAIATEHPRWNINGRSREHPDGWATSTNAPWLRGEMEVWRRSRRLQEERARLLRELESIDVDQAAIVAVIDRISSGSPVYGVDYDREGPLTVHDRKKAALLAIRGGRSA